MKSICVILICLCNCVYLQETGTGSGSDGNLRLCIVEGRGGYKRGAKFCPVLDDEKSGIECVLGNDRLDCLRRISKGSVDFGVFSPEDLVAAQWANIDVLVTDELRQRPRAYERSIVALVHKSVVPDTPWSLESVLRNTSLCHPGNGVNDLRPLSDTLAGYLESLIVTRSCDPGLSLTENRIKSMATFFNKACKAGPWVPNPRRDAELKKQYPSLCAACGSPACDASDRYWGISGALSCLVERAGDVMWGELDDVTAYFGLNKETQPISLPPADQFMFLCRDGTSQPLRNNSDPCVWLHRPWQVVVSKRKASEAVSTVLQSLNGAPLDGHWRSALASLLEQREPPHPLTPPRAPLDYLAAAQGFREAYSQSGCQPPRHISMCTTTLLEKNKCEWMSEAGAVYGVTPPLQCGLAEGGRACLEQVRRGGADVAVLPSDWLVPATRDHDLETILYETTPIVEKMDTVVAYVRRDAAINKMAELRGKRAVFPRYDGVAWHAVLRYIRDTEKISCSGVINSYFSEVCAPGAEGYNLTDTEVAKLRKGCAAESGPTASGELAALRAVVEGKSDVAFISMRTVKMYSSRQIAEPWALTDVQLVPVCPEDNKKFCYISWANIGHVYAKKNLTKMRRNEIFTVFSKLDQLFGKHQPFHSPMFTMYGPYNYQLDVLFHNNTKNLAGESFLKTHPFNKMPSSFEQSLSAPDARPLCRDENFSRDSGFHSAPSILMLLSSIVITFIRY